MAGFLPNDLTNITGVPADADVLVVQQNGDGSVKKLTRGELLQRGAVDGLCPLGPDQKVPLANIPAIAITNVYVVDDIAARDAVSPIETGDTIKVTDSDGSGNPQTYIWDGSTFIDLQETSDVISVNGETGTVTLTTGDIGVDADKNFVTDVELTNLQTMGTVDNNVLTDAELLKLQELEGTDKRVLTDIELAKLTALEGTDHNTLTDAQETKLDALEGTDKKVLTDVELAKLTALEDTDKRVLTDIELAKLTALEGTDKKVLTDLELTKLQELEGPDKRVITDAEQINVQAIGTSDHNYVTDVQSVAVAKLDTVVILTDAATVTPNMGLNSQFALGTTQDFTLENPTGLSEGQRGYIQIVQDATGSRVMTLGTNYVTEGGVGITLSTAASATDVLRFEVLSLTGILVTLIADIK